MSREKQIKEMARTLCGEKEHTCEECDSYECEFWIESSVLYNAGYRKQSEGEWIWKSNGYRKCLHCSCCGNQEEWETAFCPNCGAKMKGGE